MPPAHATEDVVHRLDALNEFERAPVTENRLQPPSYFAGLFAGEHVAATEFVIGALLVSFGASARDIVFGLLLGNLMAVLSWTLVCAPIAVQTRLTLYWYLRRIVGPGVTILYNLCNAVMYCILAGAMITVSASAVRLPFGIPAQTRWYPEDLRFVLVVLVVGAVVVTLAILGFRRLAQFAVVCAPWMFLMFLAGAVVMLPALAATLPGGRISSGRDLWTLAAGTIWTGAATAGGPSLGFWHVASFAWIANLAMHVGLSDMAIFRYARRARYGLFSAFGMYLGHYLAWICAGVMGAAVAFVLGKPLAQLDSGDIAYQALGVTGALAVVIAGWTTSNPTLYRAGLALQVVTPGWPRWLVTAIAGAVTTLVACSPFVFTRLLDFVGVYGVLLMPVGAIVFVEHWIFPRLGWTRFWASRRGVFVSVPALLAWLVPLGLGLAAWQTGRVHLFFLAGPVWVGSAVLYLGLAAFAGARAEGPGRAPEPAAPVPAAPAGGGAGTTSSGPRSRMWWVSGAIALSMLGLCLALPAAVLARAPAEPALEGFKSQLLVITLVYFVAGIIWMNENEKRRPLAPAGA
jgi:cytosine permease